MNWFKRRLIVAAIGALAIAPTGAQKNDSGQMMLEAAKQKETLEGDLPGAIKQYQAIVDKFVKTDRGVAAQALVRMAECYQLLGDAQAKKVYERIVREFADRKEEVALARARLGSTAAVASLKGDRVVWAGPKVGSVGRVSADGRFMTSVDENGSLIVHDVRTNLDRVLTPPAVPSWSQYADSSAISRDGKQVVYVWWDENDRDENDRTGLRIAVVPGSGFLEPRRFFMANDDVNILWSFDWSPDGRWIAAGITLKNGTGQIALIAVADGSLRVLKTLMDRNVPHGIFFSPDSKYIAYDLPGTDNNQQRDAFVLAIDEGREIPAVVRGAHEVMGWSPNGTRLLFSSDRIGPV